MRALRQKAGSQRGASITFALLLFLVCAVISSVVIVAATAVGGRASKIAEMDQRYYAVNSAAELLRAELEAPTVVVTTGTKTVSTVDQDGKTVGSGTSSVLPVSMTLNGTLTNDNTSLVTTAALKIAGQTAGGFVASASSSIKYCYATGLVWGTGTESVSGKSIPTDGAFAYTLTSAEDCHYFEIINEREDADVGYVCLTPLGKNLKNDNITPLDASLVDDPGMSVYNDTFANPANWTSASAYDPKLIEYYNGKYNLPNIVKLIELDTKSTNKPTVSDTDFVATHYGDWPAPEIFVLNTANTTN